MRAENTHETFCLRIIRWYAFGKLDILGDRSVNKANRSTISFVSSPSAAVLNLKVTGLLVSVIMKTKHKG